jgi:hypothetical protein
MTADLEAPAMLPMTTFLIANDVPKEHRTAACAAFGLWLEQFGEGNAPLALLHLAEALKREQDRSEDHESRLHLISELLRKLSKDEITYLGALAGISAVLNASPIRAAVSSGGVV